MLKRNYYSNRVASPKYNKTFNMNSNRVDDPTLADRIKKLLEVEEVKQNEFLSSFLPSILEQFTGKGYLSERQVEILEKNEKTFDLKTLEKTRKEYEEWCKQYDDEKRSNAKKVAEYYRNEYDSGRSHTFWYEKTATKVLEDPNHIPTKQQYEKMVLNNYAQNWLKNSSAAPKFAEGDYVTLNAQSKTYWNQRNFGSDFTELKKFEVGTVIEVKPPERNRKGANICVVLPMGGMKTVEIEERFLKKAKGV